MRKRPHVIASTHVRIDSHTPRAAGRNVTLVGLAAVLAKLMGLGEKLTLAFYFGAGPSADAYFVVTSFVVGAGTLARSLTEPVMLPLFVRCLHTQGETARAWSLFRWFLFCTIAVLGLTAAFVVARPAAFLCFLAPGLAPAAVPHALPMLRLGSLAAIFYGASAVTESALHGLGRFGFPALAELVYRALLIVACRAAGVGNFGVLALGVGILVGAAARFVLELAAIRDRGVDLIPPVGPRRSPVATSLWLLWPLFFGVLFHLVGETIETRLASLAGPGAIAARLYAKKIVELPVLLAPYVLGVVGLPYLTRLCALGNWTAVARLAAIAARWISAVFVLLGLLIASFSRPVIVMLLAHGHFSASGVTATSRVLSVYALGLPILAMEALLVPIFYAAGDTGTPSWVGAVGVTLNILGVMSLAPAYGINGIAAALVFSKAAKMVILTGCLKKYLPVQFSQLARQAAILLAALVPATTVALCVRVTSPMTGNGTLRLAGGLSIASIIVCSVFAICYYAGCRVIARWHGDRQPFPHGPEGARRT